MPELVEARYWAGGGGARTLTAATRQRLAQLRVGVCSSDSSSSAGPVPLRAALLAATQASARVADVLAFQGEESARLRARERSAAKQRRVRTLREAAAGTDLRDGRSTEQLVPQHVKAFRARRARAREQSHDDSSLPAKRRRAGEDNNEEDDDKDLLADDNNSQQQQQGEGRSGRSQLFRPLRRHAKFQPQDELKMMHALVAHGRAHGSSALAPPWPPGTWRRLAIELGQDEETITARLQRLVVRAHVRRALELALRQDDNSTDENSTRARLPSFNTLAEFRVRYKVVGASQQQQQQSSTSSSNNAEQSETRRINPVATALAARPCAEVAADIARSDPAAAPLLAPTASCLLALAAQPAATYSAPAGFRLLAKYTHAQLLGAQALLTQLGLVVRNRAENSSSSSNGGNGSGGNNSSGRALACSARFTQLAEDLPFPTGLFQEAGALADALRADPCCAVPPFPPGGTVWEALNLADAHSAALVPSTGPGERAGPHRLLARVAPGIRPLSGVLCHLVNDGDDDNDKQKDNNSDEQEQEQSTTEATTTQPEGTTTGTSPAVHSFTKATRLRADVVPLPTLQTLTVDVQLLNADRDLELFSSGPVDTLDLVVAPEQRAMGVVSTAKGTTKDEARLEALRVCCGFGAARMASVRALLRTVEAAGPAGLPLDAPTLAPDAQTRRDLRALRNFGLVATVFDVCTPRAVARAHAALWCVAPAPPRAPGADPVRPAAPWVFPDGTLDAPRVAAVQDRLLCLAARWPGVPEPALCALVPLLPAHTRRLLAALVARGRLRRTTLATAPTVSLLSAPHVAQRHAHTSPGTPGVVHCYHAVPPFCSSSSFDFLHE